MAPKLALLPPNSKLRGGIRLLVQQWPEKWQRNFDTASVLPKTQSDSAALRETDAEARYSSVDSQATERNTYSHVADGDRFPFRKDTLETIVETLHLPQSYFNDFAGRYSVPLRLKWVEYATNTTDGDARALSIVVQSPKYTGDDSFISTALSYDPIMNVTSGYLGYIFDKAKDGKGTMDCVISDLENGAALLSIHPLLLPTLILESWCGYYHEQLETSRLRLHEVEQRARILEDRYTIEASLLYNGQAQTANESKSTEQEERIMKVSYNKIHKDLSAKLLDESLPFANDLGVSCLDALGKFRFLVDEVLDVEHRKIEDLEEITQRTIKDVEKTSRSLIESKIRDLDNLHRQMADDISKETERGIWAVVESIVDHSVYAVTQEKIKSLIGLLLGMAEDLEGRNAPPTPVIEESINAITISVEDHDKILEMLKNLQQKVKKGQERTQKMIEDEVENELVQTKKDIQLIIETKDKVVQEMVDSKNVDRDRRLEPQIEGYLLHMNSILGADDQRRQRLLSRMTVTFNRLYSIIQQRHQQQDVKFSQAISLSAQHDNSVMKSISLLSMIFLPATAIATIFGMPPFFAVTNDILTVSPSFVVYWEFTLPITVLVIVLWRLWLWYSDPQRGTSKDWWESFSDLFWPFWPRTSKPMFSDTPSKEHKALHEKSSPQTQPYSYPDDEPSNTRDSSESAAKRSLLHRMGGVLRPISHKVRILPGDCEV
ncbi:hypothetical protein MMC17_004471 [Xylographa soralifera]|nr:hypothetical protein [Xylographa soralifera]